MFKILIYRRATDKKSIKGKKFDHFVRVSEYIMKYTTLRNQIPTGAKVKVFITEEALAYMPVNRFKLIESIFGEIKTPNGKRPFDLPLLPEVQNHTPKIGKEKIVQNRQKAAEGSKVFENKNHEVNASPM